jgi:glycosyltransferase involved in cell wall biosynthesis
MTNTIRPLVTIGIPTYNRARGNLKLALQSAIDQTYPNIEIIVSDNCSDDDTESIVCEFSDSRIRYFRQSHNIGANSNYNFCLEQAKGDYFLLLHDDDMIDPDLVETCINAARDNITIGIIRTGTRLINGTGDILAERPNCVDGFSTSDFFLGWMEGKTPFYFCSTLFNTLKLKEIGGLSTKKNLYEDVVAGVKLAALYGRIDVYDIKASFRIHAGNKGSTHTTMDWCEDGLYLLDTMCNLVCYKKRALIKHKGMYYFCKRNYRRASSIQSLSNRFITYVIIARKFNYAYSPIHFVYQRHLKSKVHIVKERMKRGMLWNSN